MMTKRDDTEILSLLTIGDIDESRVTSLQNKIDTFNNRLSVITKKLTGNILEQQQIDLLKRIHENITINRDELLKYKKKV
jgi:hypothetical protein